MTNKNLLYQTNNLSHNNTTTLHLKSNNLDNKHIRELDISIKNNYVRHHWTGFKG
jgi:hypothetical protein